MTKVDAIIVSIASTLIGIGCFIWLGWVTSSISDSAIHEKNSKAMFRKLVEAHNKMGNGQGRHLKLIWKGEVFE